MLILNEKEESTRISIKELPITLRVEEIAEILRVSKSNAYELVRRGVFPSFRIGRRICIPRDPFLKWLNG
jgi:excisionase family DNA binding protein